MAEAECQCAVDGEKCPQRATGAVRIEHVNAPPEFLLHCAEHESLALETLSEFFDLEEQPQGARLASCGLVSRGEVPDDVLGQIGRRHWTVPDRAWPEIGEVLRQIGLENGFEDVAEFLRWARVGLQGEKVGRSCPDSRAAPHALRQVAAQFHVTCRSLLALARRHVNPDD